MIKTIFLKKNVGVFKNTEKSLKKLTGQQGDLAMQMPNEENCDRECKMQQN